MNSIHRLSVVVAVFVVFASLARAREVSHLSASQTITEFSLPSAESNPASITAGPDGSLWFTEPNLAKIGRITTGGIITEFAVPTPQSQPLGITAGPDGNLWFTESSGNRIGRITTSGVTTEFVLPTFDSRPVGITAGPDGNLWFTENFGNKIGRITTGGVITEFASSVPREIVTGPDGHLWFTQTDDKIGRITTMGSVTEFSIPTAYCGPSGITVGPDGNLWFTELFGDKIGRITPAGLIAEFPTPGGGPSGITTGSDGNLWFTELGKIARLTLETVPAIELRILPVVGSTPGANGTFFRTALQLHNSASSVLSGRIVFHPSAVIGSGSDPALSYSLLPEETQSIADLLPALGRAGLGSADIEVTSGSAPVATARVFNDGGSSGTTGFTEVPMRTEEALRSGQQGVLLLPSDLTGFRFNLGVRTLEAGAVATLVVRDSAGAMIIATVSRAFPATYHEQQSASAFFGLATLPPGGSIEIAVSAGAAIFYGATVDNRTGDPSFQIARGPFDY
jgi:virginiamycin B lyase